MFHKDFIKQFTLDVMSYRRGDGSVGMQAFVDEYLIPVLNNLNLVYQIDDIGNIIIDNGSDILFAGHMDTCHSACDPEINQELEEVHGYIQLKNPDPHAHQVLGADCATGVVSAVLAATKGYNAVLTVGEEVGLIGSLHLVKTRASWLKTHRMCIELDRFGIDEIIHVQHTGLCASEKFAQELSDAIGFGHHPSDRGIITDNGEWNHLIPECVNVAAGYEGHHSDKENLDINYFCDLVDRLLEIDYTTISCYRKTSQTEWREQYGEDHDPFETDYWSGGSMFSSPEEAMEWLDNEDNRVMAAYMLYSRCFTTDDIVRDFENCID